MDADRRWRALASAAAATAALWVLWQRLDFGAQPEVSRCRDDAYYIFTWARSLGLGLGPCVTEGVPTSGLHLAWGLLLAAPGALLGPAAIPLAAHVLGLCLHAAGAAVAARVAGLPAGLLVLGNPFLVSEAQNGQETALATFAIALLVAARGAARVWFTLAAVLVVFARSDLWPVVVALALWREGLRPAAALAPLVALGSLLGTNLLVAGHWLQDSALPMPWLIGQWHEAIDQNTPQPGAAWRRAWWYLRPVLLGDPYAVGGAVLGGTLAWVGFGPWLARAGRATPLLLVGAAALLGAASLLVPVVLGVLVLLGSRAARPPAASSADPEGHRLACALLLGLVALVFAHEFVRRFPRDYYFAPIALAGALAAGSVLTARPRLGLLVVLAAAGESVCCARPPERYEWQQEMAMAGRFVGSLTGHESIGCFNAGLVAWHHPGRVVNLDGVVNRPAFAALQRAELSRYLAEQQVHWVMDTPVQFASFAADWPHACGRFFAGGRPPELTLRAVFDAPGIDARQRPGTQRFCLYRLGAVPLAPPALPARDLGPAPGGGRYVRWQGADGQVLRAGPLADPATRTLLAIGVRGVVFFVRVDGRGRHGLFVDDARDPILTIDL